MVQSAGAVVVRAASPVDFPRIAELTVGAYRDDGLAPAEYVPVLADVAARAEMAELLVACTDDGTILGSVALVLDGAFGEVTAGPEEAAFRMLAVDPVARGRGVGEGLVLACLDGARSAGKRRMVLSTDTRMAAAHRLYERLGFMRLPERDWSPLPGVELLVYARDV